MLMPQSTLHWMGLGQLCCQMTLARCSAQNGAHLASLHPLCLALLCVLALQPESSPPPETRRAGGELMALMDGPEPKPEGIQGGNNNYSQGRPGRGDMMRTINPLSHKELRRSNRMDPWCVSSC